MNDLLFSLNDNEGAHKPFVERGPGSVGVIVALRHETPKQRRLSSGALLGLHQINENPKSYSVDCSQSSPPRTEHRHQKQFESGAAILRFIHVSKSNYYEN